jgi:FAD/FMN-containing dehydrogenase
MTTDAGRPRQARRIKPFLAALAIVVVLAFYPLWLAVQYAAEPDVPKDCAPVDPDSGASAPMPGIPDPAAAAALPWSQRGGTINDASCLSRTPIRGVVEIRRIEDVSEALAFARSNGLRVSIAGVRHSLGGHAFARGAVVLDMTRFNQSRLDEERRILTVQSGASWHDIQNRIHPRYAVKAMQSTDIFTVGGSISVNAHGMDHRAGSVGRTVRSMRVMLPDGSIRNVSRTENARLFDLVVGGYGLFGVILDADLEVTPNVVYRSGRETLSYRDFVPALTSKFLADPAVGLMYGHLSTASHSLLDEMFLYLYRRVEAPDAVIPPLGEVSQVRLRRFVFNMSKRGPLAMRLKWFAEKRIEPLLESCTVSRNQAMGEGEACLVSRNDPMHDSVSYLRNALSGETDILHEYFIPRDQFVPFVDGLRAAVRASSVTMLNASVRVVRQEDNFLSYAPSDEMLAVVLYLNQSTDREGTQKMASLTRTLIDLCVGLGGRFFLPYQMHYTALQLERSYPNVRAFFAARSEFDPDRVLTSTFAENIERMLGINQ